MRLTGPILFFTFCLLLAARDVYTNIVKSNAPASFLLFFYCLGAALLAWIIYGSRTGNFNVWRNFASLTQTQQKTFLNLGLATCVVYGVTVLGIFKLENALVFNAIDYGAMPITTLVADRLLMKNRISKARAVGTIVASFGIAMFFSDKFRELLSVSNYRFWLLISLLSPIFTAYCSVLQKRQVETGMKPEQVLLFRFPIPALAFFCWWATARFPGTTANLGAMTLTTLLGVFLPLWLLCLAFVRETVGTLAGYLFLIPVMTLGISWIFIHAQRPILSRPEVLIAAGIIIVGCCIFEGVIRFPSSRSRGATQGQSS